MNASKYFVSEQCQFLNFYPVEGLRATEDKGLLSEVVLWPKKWK